MRFLPQSLFGRLILVLLTGLVLAQFLSAVVLLRDRGQVLSEAIRENLIDRTAGIVRLMDSLRPTDRGRLLPLLRAPELQITLVDSPQPQPTVDSESQSSAEVVKTQLSNRLPKDMTIHVSLQGSVMKYPARHMHRRHMDGRGPMSRPWAYMHGVHAMARSFFIQVRLSDGEWIVFERSIPAGVFDRPARLPIALGILLFSVVALSLIGVRSIVRPLRDLRHAAEELGRDIHRPPLTETGPLEVAATARTFNTMQKRIRSYIEDRTRILAAVSHDLKTPLTRLRLRTDLLDDEGLRGKIQADLDDMELMVSATLDFMRGSESREQNRSLDLMALLESIRDDAQDAGWKVSLQCRVSAPIQARPMALKRCIANLVENGVRYGGCAEIVADDDGNRVRIIVLDHGSGIAEELIEKVFDPFFRIESSRAKHSGGTGLGLGIARNIARAHGGDLVLRNRHDGGLCAELTLPR